MRRSFVALTLTGVTVMAVSQVAAAAATTPGWHPVRITAPSPAPFAELTSIACPRAGTCVAGGSYGVVMDQAGDRLAMVVSETHGVWQPASQIALPADAAAVDEQAEVNSVACTAPGACVAVGIYSAGTGSNGFIATESHGNWNAAVSVRLPAGAQAPPNATLTSVSCPAPGTCVAVGSYGNASADLPMVVAESGGTWRRAAAIRLLAKIAKPGVQVTIGSLSCPARRWCAALSTVLSPGGSGRSLGLTDNHGRWRAMTIRLPLSADPKFSPGLDSLSCTRAGACMAVGQDMTSSLRGQQIAETLARGTWQRAVVIAPPKPRPANWPDWLASVSCAGRSCVAVGIIDARAGEHPWTALTYRAGSWGQASRISFPDGALKGSVQEGGPRAVACVSGGTCTTVGDYAAPGPFGDFQPAAATRR